jgi:membrane-associated phospholipid phosphatase
MFALAAVCAVLLGGSPHQVPPAVRLLPGLAAVLLAAAVALVMVAIGAHTATDILAGAAVGTGVVLACALSLDLAVRRVRRGRAARPAPAVRPDDQHVA